MADTKAAAGNSASDSLGGNYRRYYDHFSKEELIELLERRTRDKARIGLNWSPDHAERDHAFNADFVTLRLDRDLCDGSAPWDHLVIEGDNFDALRWLRMTMKGSVKCIVVDPPYNTGGESWVYNDRYAEPGESGFAYTTWLEFLHRRFVLARDLLTDDGVILVNINDQNRALLEMMLDQTLPGMKVGSLVWRSRSGGNDAEGPFLSTNHEHVLVYANQSFRFGGTQKSYEMYRFFDERRNDHYRLSDLTQPKDMSQRRNGYYPLYDPTTDIYYPANPSAVWRYISRETEASAKAKTNTIEDWIAKDQIYFPEKQMVRVWDSVDEILGAIRSGNVPRSGSTLKLWEQMPDLNFWVGKRVGFGTPAFKRYKSDLKNDTQPLSSWITPSFESGTASEDDKTIISGTTEEGTKALKSIFGAKVFNYPKPVSLVRELIRQSSSPGDLVLDFFSGSATTAQAVMELNDEDKGDRRFIMVSHDEATKESPDRNICRDITAERIRLLNKRTSGVSASFAYLRTRRLPIETINDHDALTAEDIWLALQALHGLPVQPLADGNPVQINESYTARVIYCHDLTASGAMEALELAAQVSTPTHVYSWTPALVRDVFFGVEAEFHRLPTALTDRFAV